eukprot:3765931-Amphidinium_carterae.1
MGSRAQQCKSWTCEVLTCPCASLQMAGHMGPDPRVVNSRVPICLDDMPQPVAPYKEFAGSEIVIALRCACVHQLRFHLRHECAGPLPGHKGAIVKISDARGKTALKNMHIRPVQHWAWRHSQT